MKKLFVLGDNLIKVNDNYYRVDNSVSRNDICDKIQIGESFIMVQCLVFPVKIVYSLSVLQPKQKGYEPCGYKILFSTNRELVDLPLLVIENKTDDIDKLFEEHYSKHRKIYNISGREEELAKEDFIAGYKANKNKFSEEDIRMSIKEIASIEWSDEISAVTNKNNQVIPLTIKYS